MGHNICCITGGYEPVEPVRREDLVLNDEGLVDDAADFDQASGRAERTESVITDACIKEEMPLDEAPVTAPLHSAAPEKRRRGRPPKAQRDGNEPSAKRTTTRPTTIPPLDVPLPEQILINSVPPKPDKSLVAVTSINDGAVSLTYSVGTARITVHSATQDDIRAVQAIIQALTKGGL